MIKIYFKGFVNLLFELLYILIIIRLLFSFLPVSSFSIPFLNNFFRFTYQITEPILAPFRNLIPSLRAGGGARIDFSPILALLVLSLVRRFLLGML